MWLVRFLVKPLTDDQWQKTKPVKMFLILKSSLLIVGSMNDSTVYSCISKLCLMSNYSGSISYLLYILFILFLLFIFVQLPGGPVLEWRLHLPDHVAEDQAQGPSPSVQWQQWLHRKSHRALRQRAFGDGGQQSYAERQANPQVRGHLSLLVYPRQQGQQWHSRSQTWEWLLIDGDRGYIPRGQHARGHSNWRESSHWSLCGDN